MDIEEASEWMKLKSSDVCPKGYPEKWHEARGFIEAWDRQQKTIDKQREEIEGLKKKIDEWIADRDSWFERFDKRGKEIVELKAEIEGLDKLIAR